MELTSNIEDVDAITKQVRVTIAAKEVTDRIESSLGNLMRSAKVKGFRPGKAPRAVVDKLHGGRVRQEVATELVTSSLRKVAQDNGIFMVGEPEVVLNSIEPLEYTAKVLVYPQPTVEQYDSFVVSAPRKKVTEEQVDGQIEEFRKTNVKTVPLEGRTVSAAGDVVHLLIEGLVGGRSLGRAEPVTIALGEGQLPAAVEAAVVGVEIGAPIPDVPVKLGDRHPNKKLRNRTIVYRVQLEGLSEKVLPTVTDEFVATVLPDVGTVAALREKFRQELELVADSEARSLVQAEILSKLLEANQFEVPQPLIDEEIMNMLLRGGVLDPMRIDIRKVDISRFRDGLGEVALRRVRSAIVVDRIGEAEKILATPDEVAEALKDIAEETGRSLDTVKNDYSGSRGRGLVIELTRDKVLEFLTARAVITYTEPPPVEAATPSSESPEGGETVASGG